MPKELANRDFWANNMNENIESLDLPYRKPEVIEALKEAALKHGKAKASQDRNRAHVCSFFV